MSMTIEPRGFLAAELDRRRVSNKRYSLRAFAAALDLNAGYLSRVLSGQIHLSVGAAKRVSASLNLAGAETKALLTSAANAAQMRSLNRNAPEIDPQVEIEVREIDADAYAVISDMHHYAILELTFLPDFQPGPKWIARRLGITTIDAEYAVARLLRLGLLKREDGTLKKTDRSITTRDKSITTPALKKSQRQILRLAQHALERDPIEKRSATGMTMAIDPVKIPLAKQMIQTFMEQLCNVLESGSRREVYQLSVNLFALTSPTRLGTVAAPEFTADMQRNAGA